MYLLETMSLYSDLLLSPTVQFDMLKSVPTEEKLKIALPGRTAEEYTEMFEELNARAGRLGGFKLESKEDCIVEFIGLAPKMYSIKLKLLDGEEKKIVKGCKYPKKPEDTITKAKGVAGSVVKKNAPHEVYRDMLFNPKVSRATFRKLQSFKHKVCGLEITRNMLTSLQDKTYQLSTTESRPLGHWRNLLLDAKEEKEEEEEEEEEEEAVVVDGYEEVFEDDYDDL